MSRKHDRATELRAIADGRLLLHVRNGVTVSRSMLAKIADEMDAERAAHAKMKRERDDLKDEWEAEYETRIQYQTRLRGTEARLAELAAENERLKHRSEHYEKLSGERHLEIRRLKAEAPASTGAVKALPRPDTVSMSGGAICLEYADYDLRDAAYDWLEAHGAGDELELHPRATSTVVSHETANVEDNRELWGHI